MAVSCCQLASVFLIQSSSLSKPLNFLYGREGDIEWTRSRHGCPIGVFEQLVLDLAQLLATI
jgi:hypothetical protein